MSPIRESERHRYPPPKEWRAIREAILIRSMSRTAITRHISHALTGRTEICERCGKPNGCYVSVWPANRPQQAWSNQALGGGEYRDGRLVFPWWSNQGQPHESRDGFEVREGVRVVLTIAHLDQQPENNDPENLRAWCQRCHNVHDLPFRIKGIRERARAAELKVQPELYSRPSQIVVKSKPGQTAQELHVEIFGSKDKRRLL